MNFGVKKNITWNPKICTADDKKTDAFGTLDFENNDVQIISKVSNFEIIKLPIVYQQ